MTGKSNQRVSVRPKEVDDVDPIIRRAVDAHQRHIREIACGLDVSGTGALSAEAAFDGILQSMGSDWKAPEEDVECYMKADMRGWWRDFPEQELLSELYEQAALWKDGPGSDDSEPHPEPAEGRRVAEASLADIRVTGKLDAAWEAAAVAQSLADLWLSPPRRPVPPHGAKVYQEIPVHTRLLQRAQAHLRGVGQPGRGDHRPARRVAAGG